jgi:hypothetical protein
MNFGTDFTYVIAEILITIVFCFRNERDRDSSVDITTCCRLDGSGFEFR